VTKKHAHTVSPRRLDTSSPDELIATHARLQRLVVKAKAGKPPGSVNYDLSECESIDPGALLLMMYAGAKLGELGWDAYATGEGTAHAIVLHNLTHFNLSDEERKQFPKEVGEFPLRAVKDANHMVAELDDWASTVRQGAGANPEDVAEWQTQIAEVTTNAIQHGPTGLSPERQPMPPILLAGHADKQTRRVQLAVIDRGAGVPAVLRPKLPEHFKGEKDGRIIKEACRPGVTSRCSPQNQGAGLPTLVGMVKANGGTLQIFSHRGLVHVRNGKMYHRTHDKSDRRLEGTLTILTLRIGA